MNKQMLSIRFEPAGDFASFGAAVMAYVKKVDLDGRQAYAVCTADGTTIGIESSEEGAMICARQNNLFPVVVQ